MAKIINTYQNLAAAQEAVAKLSLNGFDATLISVIGHDDKRLLNAPDWRKSLLWGGAAGAMATLLMPGGGHRLLAGHLVRTATMHILRVTVKGIMTGVAVGGTIDLLRRAGLDHRMVKEAEVAVTGGGFAVLIESDWATIQRARLALAAEQEYPDPKLIEIVRRHGYEHQSFLSLYGNPQVWYADDLDAAVVYRLAKRVAIVVAAPLAPREHWAEATRRFLGFCKEQKRDCLMVPVGPEYAEIARQCGMALLPIGESGYFELPGWKPAGDRAKKVRSGANQARRAGISIEQYDPARNRDIHTRCEIEELCQTWIDTREVDALGWLLELDPFALSEHKRYFLAKNADGRLVGLLACCPIPARRGWYLEDLIRDRTAERGVSELLVVEALKHLAEEGALVATLATSPLAGLETTKNRPAQERPESQFKHLSKLLNLIYEHLDAFYHFKALHRFKAKFAPSFIEPEYLAIYPPRIRLRMIFALIGAFDPAGLTGVMASKLRKLWKETRRTGTNHLQE